MVTKESFIISSFSPYLLAWMFHCTATESKISKINHIVLKPLYEDN